MTNESKSREYNFDLGLAYGMFLGWNLARHAFDVGLDADARANKIELLIEVAEGRLTVQVQPDELESQLHTPEDVQHAGELRDVMGELLREEREHARRILALL